MHACAYVRAQRITHNSSFHGFHINAHTNTHACMHACMYVFIAYKCTWHTSKTKVKMLLYMTFASTHAHTNIHTHILSYTHIHTCTHIQTNIHTCIHVYIQQSRVCQTTTLIFIMIDFFLAKQENIVVLNAVEKSQTGAFRSIKRLFFFSG
jgi:hypothetical protein